MDDIPMLTNSAPAAVRETHSGVVFLLGDRAYKLKKPVTLAFLDFSTRELRDEACHREVTLNRRLAPDVYLGVATVCDAGGQPCESLVVMRRMPDDRRLSTLVTAGVDVRADLRQLARDLAAFHATANSTPEIAQAGSADRLIERWRSNVDDLRRLGVTTGCADLLWREATEYVEGRGPLFSTRMARRLVRDGHGDLLAEDIFCLSDGPRALDCLDFDPQLRWMDVLDDIACLAMDLEHLGASEAARQFTADYAEFSGSPQPESLLHHYIAYRSVMRAKVTAIRKEQLTSALTVAGPPQGDLVEQLVHLGIRHLAQGQVRLLLVGGAPATGKTTLARAFSDDAGTVLLSSDRTRKELLGLDPQNPHPEPYLSGIYAASVTDDTYAALAERAAQALSMGESVVVDASFAADRHRAVLRSVAQRAHARAVEIQCVVSPAVQTARLTGRSARPDPYTDAGLEVGTRMAHDFETWPEAVSLDGSSSLPQLIRDVRALWTPPWAADG